jgi:hypothetical protein
MVTFPFYLFHCTDPALLVAPPYMGNIFIAPSSEEYYILIRLQNSA